MTASNVVFRLRKAHVLSHAMGGKPSGSEALRHLQAQDSRARNDEKDAYLSISDEV